MKTGDILIAINPYRMGSDKRPTLTVGKQYVAQSVSPRDFYVVDDEGDNHWFNIKGVHSYTKYFVPINNSEIYY